MAIAPLVKVSIAGLKREKMQVLDELQELGCIHVTSYDGIDHPVLETTVVTPRREAYQYLRHCPDRRRQASDIDAFDLAKVEEETLSIRSRALDLQTERDFLEKRIKTLEPWGDFQFPHLSEVGNYRLWFYTIPLNKMKAFYDNQDLAWAIISQDSTFAYIVVISQIQPDSIPAPRVHTGDKPLSWLKGRLVEVDEELEDLHWRRVGLTRWLTQFARHLAAADDLADLKFAAEHTYDDAALFMVNGWLSKTKIQLLVEYAEKHGLLMHVEPPSAEDKPPTCLENPDPFKGGESLVCFYTTPAYNLWDPSIVVFLSFLIFFSMILADAGYGLILAGMWFLTRKSLSRLSPGLCDLFKYLVCTTIGFGVLVGSYFGLSPGPDSILGFFKVLEIQDKDQMMMVSILVGVIHLALAQVVNFNRADGIVEKLPSLGWLAVLAGGVILWLESTLKTGHNAAGSVGYVVAGAGGCLLLLFSSARPWKNATWKDHVGRLVDGLLTITGVSRIFGDILSYLRLFALGLASAQLAITFNDLAVNAKQNFAGIGIFVAILILTLGHGLNFVLAIMSGVVHGLRLNYIEFFNWSLTEEGHKFRPFSKRRVDSWNI